MGTNLTGSSVAYHHMCWYLAEKHMKSYSAETMATISAFLKSTFQLNSADAELRPGRPRNLRGQDDTKTTSTKWQLSSRSKSGELLIYHLTIYNIA